MTMYQQNHLEAIQDIRKMMEQSSRFISLSGLSGVVAGCWALLGATVAYIYLDMSPFDGQRINYYEAIEQQKWGVDYLSFFLINASLVLFLAVSSGILFTTHAAKKKGQKIWGPLTRRLLINLMIPLVAGGVFCLAMLHHGILGFIAPATLIFYGLALVNASKYTLNDIRYLGISEIVLGLVAIFFLGHGLAFWVIGFGFLHIIYGTLMYMKYERKA
jgi:lysylphosphatidylglycerol synthetase-like protein (DUF2156 family)